MKTCFLFCKWHGLAVSFSGREGGRNARELSGAPFFKGTNFVLEGGSSHLPEGLIFLYHHFGQQDFNIEIGAEDPDIQTLADR